MEAEKEKILQTMSLLEAQRPLLGDAAVEAALSGLRLSLEKLEAALKPPPPPTSLEGERKLVTVMFADFSNFTSMSERLDAEEVRDLMNQCFSWLVPIIEHYGGVIDKFIGDEIMALFGAPHAHDNDAECALRAALDMMQQLTEFNAKYQTNLGLHFGINTGTVIAGGVGSTERQQYSVMGDAVNLAARLEDASVTGEILVGYETYRLTAPLFDFEERAPISVKGKAQPVAIYRLMGLKAIPQSVRGIEGLYAPMIGREEELTQLQTAIEALSDAKGSTIAIVAESGLGKSRLMAELKKSKPDIPWLEGKGQSFSQSDSYGLPISLIDSELSIISGSSIAQIGNQLWQYLQTHLPTQADTLYPYLARLRGIPLEQDTEALFRAMQPETMHSRIHHAFAQWLGVVSDQQPLVVVWEDLHWADDSSLRLIESLMKWVQQKPILMLLVFRPHEGIVQQYQEKWSVITELYKEIALSPLNEQQSNSLINSLLRIKNLPDATRQIILEKSEGNPFYLEELLRSMLDTGLLYWQEGEILLRQEVQQLHIPNTLQAVIEARIDRLGIQEKSILQNASVIGRLFGQQVLEYLVEQSKRPMVVSPTLQSLEERELIRQKMMYEYIFKHAVTQDVSYNSMLLTKRRELHHYAAQALESLFADRKEEMASALAWHYQRAKNHDKAIAYLTIAADRARLTYSYRESAYFYSEAIREAEQCTDIQWQKKVSLYQHQGEVQVSLAQYDQARQSYQYALQAIQDTDALLRARIWQKIGESYVSQRQPHQELIAYDAALKWLGVPTEHDSLPHQHTWIDLQLARIWSHYWLNQTQEMAEILKQIEATTEQIGTARQQALWSSRMVLYFLRTQRFTLTDPQLALSEKALQLSYQAHDYELIDFHQSSLGMAYYFTRHFTKAKDELLAAIELAQKIGNFQVEVVSYQFFIQACIATNDVETVTRYTPIMEEKATDKLPFYLFQTKGFYAWLAWKKGDLQEAEKHAMESLRLHNGVPVPNTIPLWTLVAVLTNQSRHAEAMDYLKVLLRPYQYRIPTTLEQQMTEGIEAIKQGSSDGLALLLNNILQEAHKKGYM
jgi:class 3 adenylate cyclase